MEIVHSCPGVRASRVADVACRLNPYAEYAYDGLALNPLEVMFVKVKGFQLQAEWASAQLASTYQRWLSSHVRLHPVAHACSMALLLQPALHILSSALSSAHRFCNIVFSVLY